jgi:uncharacterized protein YcbK (DUF882 family)
VTWKNFQLVEFDCPCCGKNDISHELIDVLQIIRDEAHAPMIITSGYRCEAHNTAIGGAPKSQHLKGLAADFHIAMWGAARALDLIKRLYREGRIYVGYAYMINGRSVHLDIRRPPSQTVRRWTQ